MSGRLFTGPNGNAIFLPAPGIHWNDILTGESTYGHYWSSTLGESAYYEPYNAFVLNFNSEKVELYDDNRSFGRSVRPVTK